MEEKYTTVRINTKTLADVKKMAKETGISVPRMLDAAVGAICLLKYLNRMSTPVEGEDTLADNMAKYYYQARGE